MNHSSSKETVGGLLSKGLLSKIDTLLLPVKSICIFKSLFFLPCVPDFTAFLGITGLSWFFYWIFLLGRLTLLSCLLTCNPTFYYFKNKKLLFFLFSIWVNLNNIFVPKRVYIITIFVENFALIILGLDKSPLDKCPTTIKISSAV